MEFRGLERFEIQGSHLRRNYKGAKDNPPQTYDFYESLGRIGYLFDKFL